MVQQVELKRGLRDVYFDDTQSSNVIGDIGRLIYRGYDIHDLAENSTFEETAYLLLYGSLPTRSQLDAFDQELRASRKLPDEVVQIIGLTASSHPMDVLRIGCSTLGVLEPETGSDDAIDVADLLGINHVVVPLNPGIASAFGLLTAEFKNDYARTFLQQAPGYDLDGIERVYAELEAEGRTWLDEEGVPQQVHSMSRSADLRYAHQGSEVTVLLSDGKTTGESMSALIQEFHSQHQQLYGFALDQPVEIVTLRVTVSGDVGSVSMPRLTDSSESPEKAILDRRQVYFDQSNGFVGCNIYSREQLAPGASIPGPAILEGMDSTVVINPGWATLVDDYGNCIMRPE